MLTTWRWPSPTFASSCVISRMSRVLSVACVNALLVESLIAFADSPSLASIVRVSSFDLVLEKKQGLRIFLFAPAAARAASPKPPRDGGEEESYDDEKGDFHIDRFYRY